MAGIRPTGSLASRLASTIAQSAKGKAAQPKINVAAIRHFPSGDQSPKTNQALDLRKTSSTELQEKMQKIRERFALADSNPQSSEQAPSSYAGILGTKKNPLLTDTQKQAFAANITAPDVNQDAKAAIENAVNPKAPPLVSMPPPPPPPPLGNMPPFDKSQTKTNVASLLFQELKAKAKPEIQDPEALKQKTQAWEKIYNKHGSALEAYKREVKGQDVGKAVKDSRLSAAENFAASVMGELELDASRLINDAFNGAKTLDEMEAKAVKTGTYAVKMLELIKAYPSLYENTVKAEGMEAKEAKEDLSARILKRLSVASNRFSFVDNGAHSKIFLINTPEVVKAKLLDAALKAMTPSEYDKLISEQSRQTVVASFFQSPSMKAYEKLNGSAASNQLREFLQQEIAREPNLKQALVHFYDQYGVDNFKATSYKGLQDQNAGLKDEIAELKARLKALEKNN